MSMFTIESTYRVPVYRQRRYRAETLADACRLAIEDDDWEGKTEDYESTGETYVTGAWAGDAPPYSTLALMIPTHFGETIQRKGDHFEVLLGLLKVFAYPPNGGLADEPSWRRRLHIAITKGEAILAGARDPESETGDAS